MYFVQYTAGLLFTAFLLFQRDPQSVVFCLPTWMGFSNQSANVYTHTHTHTHTHIHTHTPYIHYVHVLSANCIVEESIPESESTLAGDEGEENITIICTLLREAGGPQQVTEWFIERPGQTSPQLILDNQEFANFEIVGEPIPNTTNSDSRTNFTVLNLTSDLDRAVIFCGLGGINPVFAANFTLRIYSKFLLWVLIPCGS